MRWLLRGRRWSSSLAEAVKDASLPVPRATPLTPDDPSSVLFTRDDRDPLLLTARCKVLEGQSQLLYKCTSESYFAVRIPLLRAGFKRLPRDSEQQCNVVWRRPFSIPENATSDDYLDGDDDTLITPCAGLRPTHPEQRTNHFPSSYTHLGSKDGMYRAIEAMAKRFGEPFNIVPHTWVLPDEHQDLLDYLAVNPDSVLISKPARGSCGRDIFVVGGTKDPRIQRLLTFATAPEPPPLPPSTDGGFAADGRRLRTRKWVVQKYIDPPLLIQKRKFDMRLYVAVTSINPLVAYVHREGLIRFASEDYGKSSRLSHLTNSSLARKRDAALRKKVIEAADVPPQEPDTLLDDPIEQVIEPAAEPPPLIGPLEQWATRSRFPDEGNGGQGDDDASWPRFKWSVSELQQWVKLQEGVRAWDDLWGDICNVIVKGLVSSERHINAHLQERDPDGRYRDQSFELFGFDVMVDADWKPWLIEVNCIPSLESSSSMDWAVKYGCVTDLFNMLAIKPFERDANEMDLRQLVDSIKQQILALTDENATDETPKEVEDVQQLQEILVSARKELRQLAEKRMVAEGETRKEFDAVAFCDRLNREDKVRGGYHRIFPTPGSVRDNAAFFAGSPSESRNKELWKAMGATVA